jgi:hypothetical protein
MQEMGKGKDFCQIYLLFNKFYYGFVKYFICFLKTNLLPTASVA